jgi:hypothetical protein
MKNEELRMQNFIKNHLKLKAERRNYGNTKDNIQ